MMATSFIMTMAGDVINLKSYTPYASTGGPTLVNPYNYKINSDIFVAELKPAVHHIQEVNVPIDELTSSSS
jgi:hypothetical protein